MPCLRESIFIKLARFYNNKRFFVPFLSPPGTKLDGVNPVFIQQFKPLSRFVPLLGQFSLTAYKSSKSYKPRNADY